MSKKRPFVILYYHIVTLTKTNYTKIRKNAHELLLNAVAKMNVRDSLNNNYCIFQYHYKAINWLETQMAQFAVITVNNTLLLVKFIFVIALCLSFFYVFLPSGE